MQDFLSRTKRQVIFNLVTWTLAFLCAPASADMPPRTSTDPIWDVAAGESIDVDTFLSRAAASDIILLGETHDDPAHHAIQTRVLRAMIDAGRKPALVMEQFDLEQQRDIDAAVTPTSRPADAVDALVGMMSKGWDRALYRPILEAGLSASLPIVAANLSRGAARSLAMGGLDLLGKENVASLKLDEIWTTPRQEAMTNAIREGHCGMLPEEALDGMAAAQRARDALMADALLQKRGDGAVGIFGRGHVARDLAVPLYVDARGPQRQVMSVAIVEADAAGNPHDFAHGPLGRRYDYVWRTPPPDRKDDQDPCAAFGASTKRTPTSLK